MNGQRRQIFKQKTQHSSYKPHSISMYTINTALIIELANNGIHAWDMLWDEKTFFSVRIEVDDINIAQRYFIIGLESRCIWILYYWVQTYKMICEGLKLPMESFELWVQYDIFSGI